MADFDYTFGGQLQWEVDAQCFETDITADGIERDILATRESWTDKEKAIIGELSILLACTRSVEIVGNQKPANAVLRMVDVINNHPDPAELIAWRFKMPYKLKNAWENAWIAGQDMFTNLDPAQLPSSALSPDQQEQAKDPKSFLAATG